MLVFNMENIQDGILFFNASWCGPCKSVKKYLTPEVMEEYGVINVDISEHPELAAQHQVASVPTFVKLKEGSLEKFHVGRLSFEDLKTF